MCFLLSLLQGVEKGVSLHHVKTREPASGADGKFGLCVATVWQLCQSQRIVCLTVYFATYFTIYFTIYPTL